MRERRGRLLLVDNERDAIGAHVALDGRLTERRVADLAPHVVLALLEHAHEVERHVDAVVTE